MKSVPAAKKIEDADIENVGFDFEKRLCETDHLDWVWSGSGEERHFYAIGTSVSLCYREGRLERGYSCDWEEQWSLGQHRERSGHSEGT